MVRSAFEQAFPETCREDLEQVLQILPTATVDNISILVSVAGITYNLSDYFVQFPYRIYLEEPKEERIQALSDTQKLILACIYTRSHDGYIRQKYVKEILDVDFPAWCIPYIVKLCDEYVAEILEVIYDGLKDRDNGEVQEFCRNNRERTRKGYARMTSYWNEYYRVTKFQKYIGRKLYRQCLGYTKSFEK